MMPGRARATEFTAGRFPGPAGKSYTPEIRTMTFTRCAGLALAVALAGAIGT